MIINKLIKDPNGASVFKVLKFLFYQLQLSVTMFYLKLFALGRERKSGKKQDM